MLLFRKYFQFPLWKSHFRIHTFEDEIEFIQGLEKSTGRKVGIYPEIKAPWFHHQNGKDIAAETLKVLKNMAMIRKPIWFTYKLSILMN